jgi:predicted DNA-binding transcriptional regulator YafY
MRRADRLFRIVQYLRRGRLLTARELAGKLEVSERTIYRDVRDLQLSGMPIEGEAGVGYTLRRDFDLPPLMFTRKEITALVLGARLVEAWGGTENVEAARSALQRIEAALPVELQEELDATLLFAPEHQLKAELRGRLDQLHTAAVEHRMIRFRYTRGDGEGSERDARPLGLAFWSGVWTLAAWCELRGSFRVFRMDRMEDLTVGERFEARKGQSWRDYLKTVGLE